MYVFNMRFVCQTHIENNSQILFSLPIDCYPLYHNFLFLVKTITEDLLFEKRNFRLLTVFTDCWRFGRSSFILSPISQRAQSSANKLTESGICTGKSFIITENKIGLVSLPCGTPLSNLTLEVFHSVQIPT